MDKKQFEQMIPTVKKIIEMAKKARKQEEEESAERTGPYGINKDMKEVWEEIYDDSNPRVQLSNYLSDMDHQELKILQSFMLTGSELSGRIDKFDNETIQEIFDEFLERPYHQGKKSALVGYVSSKTNLDTFLSDGLKIFETINHKNGVIIEDKQILKDFIGGLLNNPKKIEDYEVYNYQHIDILDFMPEAEKAIKEFEGSKSLINKVKSKLKENGWEGDGTLRFLWLPPFVFSSSDTWGTLIWLVKQRNNGTTFICSPRSLPFDNLRRW